jgi:hypothetical protein
MVIVKLPLAVVPFVSVTVAETEMAPGAAGVPLTAPLLETVNPPPAEPVNV